MAKQISEFFLTSVTTVYRNGQGGIYHRPGGGLGQFGASAARFPIAYNGRVELMTKSEATRLGFIPKSASDPYVEVDYGIVVQDELDHGTGGVATAREWYSPTMFRKAQTIAEAQQLCLDIDGDYEVKIRDYSAPAPDPNVGLGTISKLKPEGYLFTGTVSELMRVYPINLFNKASSRPFGQKVDVAIIGSGLEPETRDVITQHLRKARYNVIESMPPREPKHHTASKGKVVEGVLNLID